MAWPRVLGYSQNPGSNFVIASLAGGKRDANGFELSFRKRFERNWQWQASYNYLRAKGNTDSIRAPTSRVTCYFSIRERRTSSGSSREWWRTCSRRPGRTRRISACSWEPSCRRTPGTLASRTAAIAGPQPASAGGPYAEFRVRRHRSRGHRAVARAGFGGRPRQPGMGTGRRARAVRVRVAAVSTELFVDLFNVTNSQATIRTQDLVAGQGTIRFGDVLVFNPPRRPFLGARLNF